MLPEKTENEPEKTENGPGEKLGMDPKNRNLTKTKKWTRNKLRKWARKKARSTETRPGTQPATPPLSSSRASFPCLFFVSICVWFVCALFLFVPDFSVLVLPQIAHGGTKISLAFIQFVELIQNIIRKNRK